MILTDTHLFQRKHYIFQSSTTRHKEDTSNLVKIGADLQVWEFIQYLGTGGSAALQNIPAVSGQVGLRFILQINRGCSQTFQNDVAGGSWLLGWGSINR